MDIDEYMRGLFEDAKRRIAGCLRWIERTPMDTVRDRIRTVDSTLIAPN